MYGVTAPKTTKRITFSKFALRVQLGRKRTLVLVSFSQNETQEEIQISSLLMTRIQRLITDAVRCKPEKELGF